MLNGDLRSQLEGDVVDAERVGCLLQEAHQNRVPLDVNSLGYAMKGQMERRAAELAESPEDLPALQRFLTAAELLPALPFETNLWKAQNTYWVLQCTVTPAMRERARKGDETARSWLDKFLRLGDQLRFRVESSTS